MSNPIDEQKLIQSSQAAVTQTLEAMTVEEREAATIYQEMMHQLSENLAKKMAKPGTIGVKWEHGFAYANEKIPEIVEAIMRRFFGVMGLGEFVTYCASMAGYQAGIARSKGYDLPEDAFEQYGKVFASGMRVFAASGEVVARAGLTTLVPGLPEDKH